MQEGGIVAVALQIATDDYLHFLVSSGKIPLVFFFWVFVLGFSWCSCGWGWGLKEGFWS
jgi:hypothetical protein